MALSIEEKSAELEQFADSLHPDAEYIRIGRRTANELFDILRSSDLRIDRVCIAGSVGKYTSIQFTDNDGYSQNPDFDLVVFINEYDCSSFFASMPNRISQILGASNRGIVIRDVRTYSVKLTFNDYRFDLIPAINFVQGSRRDVRIRQRDRTYQEIKRSQLQDTHRFNCCLAETAVHFMEKQTPFVHSIVKIAKYWASNCYFKSFPGKKLLIETVAVRAAQVIERQQRPWYDGQEVATYNGVKKFLQLMKNFGNIRVYITSDDTYEDRDITEQIWDASQLVLDPANPFNNLAAHPGIHVEGFEEAARWSLSKLNRIGIDDWSDILMSPPDEADDGVDAIANNFFNLTL